MRVDGRPVRYAVDAPRRVEQSFLAYHKPGSSAVQREREESVEPDIPAPKRGRWVGIGSLEPSTTGLALLTTDGELANRLMRLGGAIEREYALRFTGTPSAEQVERLLAGVELDEGPAGIVALEPSGGAGTNVWYRVVLRDGRYRALRAACDAVGVVVNRVMLVRYGPVELGRLHRDANRPLTPIEVNALYAAAGIPRNRETRRAGARPGKTARPGRRRKSAAR